MKAAVDEAVSKKMWKVFYFHDDYEISLQTMEKLIDYIQSISSDKLEVVTYKQMYTKFAEKESIIKNTAHTYYVSADGKSTLADTMFSIIYWFALLAVDKFIAHYFFYTSTDIIHPLNP